MQWVKSYVVPFFKQKSEEYGTEGWYNTGYMKMFMPNIYVNPNDIQKLQELEKRRTEISKLWNQINDEERLQKSQQAQNDALRGENLIKWAIEEFGVTYSLGKAGYILPDGRLLDFSGGGPNRGTDHRAIEGLYKRNGINIWDDRYRYNYVVDFLNQGAIRCDFNSGVLDMTREPSQGAFRAIKDFVRNADDISIDFTNGSNGDTDYSVYYENPSPSRIVADIKRYYEEGIKPIGDE